MGEYGSPVWPDNHKSNDLDIEPVKGGCIDSVPSCGQENDYRRASPAQEQITRDKLWKIIAQEIACESDCQKWPNGCGCAQKAADKIVSYLHSGQKIAKEIGRYASLCPPPAGLPNDLRMELLDIRARMSNIGAATWHSPGDTETVCDTCGAYAMRWEATEVENKLLRDRVEVARTYLLDIEQTTIDHSAVNIARRGLAALPSTDREVAK